MTERAKSRRSPRMAEDLEDVIAQLRQAQESLRVRHGQLRILHVKMQAARGRCHDLFQSAPVGYVATDGAGRIVETNRMASALLGGSLLLTGKPFTHFLGPEDQGLFQEKFQRCRAGRHVRPFEVKMRRMNGTWITAQLILLREKQVREPREIRIIMVDLTELKRAQEQLEDAKRDLENRVEQRTRELKENVERLAEEAAHRARLEEELLQISERERRRFGQDLHDDICQALTGLALELGAFSRQLSKDENPRSAESQRLAVALGDLVRQTRRIAHGLHPVGLSGGLVRALEELVATFSPRLPCHLHLPRTQVHLSPAVELALYRIVQEALTNVVKHARATRADVRLQVTSKALLLTVADDGIGLPTALESDTGMGLDILGYRARSIGAALVVENQPRGGVRVACQVPKSALVASSSAARDKTEKNNGAGR